MNSIASIRIIKSYIAVLLLGFSATSYGIDVVSGESVAEQILPLGEVDVFSAEANAGDTLYFSVAKLGGDANFRPFIRLLDPQGALVTSNSGLLSADVSTRATVRGVYRFEVLDDSAVPNGTGSYQAYFGRVPADHVVPGGDEGGALSNGAIHVGSIPLADIDLWTIELDANDSLLLGLAETGGDGSLDPFLLLYAPDGSLVTSNANSATSADLTHRAKVAGVYTVVVKDGNTDVTGVGDYQLYAQRILGEFIVPSGDEGGALTNGEVHTGSIELADIDAWTIRLEAEDTLVVGIGEINGNNSFDPFLILYGPDGAQITSNSNSATSTDLSHKAVVGGTYTVVVKDGNTDVIGTGDYNLYFTSIKSDFVVPVDDEGGPLVNGAVHSGSIVLGDIDPWTIELAANDSLVVGIGETDTDASFDPFLTLYDPNGERITSNSNSASSTDLSHRAFVGGTYTLLVQDGNTDVIGVGDYKLYATQVSGDLVDPVDDDGGPITNGMIHPGSIELGDIDAWTIELDANDTVIVGLGETNGDNSFDPFVILYGPDGERITSNSNSASSTDFSHQARVAGTYTMVVKDGNTDVFGVGDYNLFVSRIPDIAVVTSGDEGGIIADGVVRSGSITLADIDTWRFSGRVLDDITVSLTDTGATNFDPFLLLYNPTGDLITSDFDANNASITRTLTSSGTYTLVVKDGNTDVFGVGDYELLLDVVGNAVAEPSGSIVANLVSGGRQAGTLMTPTDVDKFSLSVLDGEQVQLKLGDDASTSFFTPVLQVFDSSGGLQYSASGSNIAEINFRASANETLTVVVGNAANTAGSYDYLLHTAVAPRAFVVPANDEGRALVSGDRAVGVLTTSDIDIYQIQATEGNSLLIKLGDSAGTSFFSPELSVYGADGRLIAFDVSSNIALTEFSAHRTELLTLVVSNNSTATGSYDYVIDVAVVPEAFVVPPGDEGGDLVNGQTRTGSLALADIDLFRVSVSAGTKTRLKLGDEASTSFFSPLLRVYDSLGVLLSESSGSNIAEAYLESEVDQTFLVQVSNATRTTGTYDYLLSTAVAADNYSTAATDQGAALVNGVVTSGDLFTADIDMFKLAVDPGDTVRIKLADPAGTSFFSPQLQVFSSAGNLIATNVGSNIAEVNFVADLWDELRLVVANNVTSTGVYNYDLHASLSRSGASVLAPDTGGGISNGDITIGTLDAGDIDEYTLAVPAGAAIQIKLGDVGGTSFFTPDLQVFSETGALVAAAVGSNIAEAVFSSEVERELRVRVTNNALSTGTFTYNLHSAVAPGRFITPLGDSGGVLSNGVTVSGALTTADFDLFSPSVVAGQAVTISLEDVAGTSFFTPAVSVFSSTGDAIAFGSGSNLATVTFVPTVSELITVVVANGTTNTASHDYQLNASGLGSPVDSDMDGLSDAVELFLGTNINSADTDGDGLSDFDEVNFDGDQNYDEQLDSNPLVVDTDGDGFSDGVEVDAGTNPIDPASQPYVFTELRQGLNLVSLPSLVLVDTTSCFGLLAQFGGPGTVESIVTIEVGSQNPIRCEYSGPDAVGEDYALAEGVAYFVRMSAAASLDFAFVAPSCPVVSLAPGVNPIGIPLPVAGSTCRTVLEAVGFGASTMERLNPETGLFESCGRSDAEIVGRDYPIASGEGYLLHYDGAGEVVNLNDLANTSICH